MKFLSKVIASLATLTLGGNVNAQDNLHGDVYQPLASEPGELDDGSFYIPSTIDTVLWGSLPNRNTEPVLSVPSGAIVIFDSVSHEGILEDQGRNPVEYFSRHGVAPNEVLDDARTIAASALDHDFDADCPHVVT